MELLPLFAVMKDELARHGVTLPAASVRFRHGPVASFPTLGSALVFEAVYRRLFLIEKREFELLTSHHDPEQRVVYFVLRETNHRRLLPAVVFAPVTFAVHYDEGRRVSQVVNHFDFNSWLLAHLGLDAPFHRLSATLTRVARPLAGRHTAALERVLDL